VNGNKEVCYWGTESERAELEKVPGIGDGLDHGQEGDNVSPERTASQIAQLIAQLSKLGGKKFPEPWTPSDFISLINSYQGLIRAMANRPDSGKSMEQLMRDGQGYEAAQGWDQ